MDESNPNEFPKADATTPDSGMPISQSMRRTASAARASLIGAMLLVVVDAVLGGSYLFSILACPIWFLVSVIKNLIELPGWSIALFRIAVPALTLGSVLGITAIQSKIADTNAKRIINACEEFHDANGRYPHTLDELVPRYLGSIPRAKYCLMFGDFWYFNYPGSSCMLMWVKVPPFGRNIYHFEDRRWGYLD